MDNSDFLVTVADLERLRDDPQDASFCVRGLKAWANSHDLDFKDFVRNGIPISKLEATGDATAMLITARLRKERQHGHE